VPNQSDVTKSKHALDRVRQRDVSGMGYEAKIAHRERLESARKDFERASGSSEAGSAGSTRQISPDAANPDDTGGS